MFKGIFKCVVCLIPGLIFASSDLISINKNNVTYHFVPFDEPTDHFTRDIFENWEPETFAVFEQVKDKEAIAIDIGAWIGTTAIWLSKNFHHVIAVEPDYKSVNCLQKNLAASDCLNVSLSDRPLSNTCQKVIFGSRGAELNASISYIKNQSDNSHDYMVRPITFKQLIYDYVYDQETLKNRKISFIKCDIEGGEEDILEDILHFAYNNQCKVYMSFHLSWWKSKKITDFEYLFKYFKTNLPGQNICDILTKYPFASVLFEPIDAGVLVKKNMTALIIGYNQYTYIKNMVQQLEKYTSDIIVVDNASTYQPLLDYYDQDFKYTLLRQKFNYGVYICNGEYVQKLVGDVYLLSDPDLKFNPNLPDNFIQELVGISNHFQANKVGFALNITADDIRTDLLLTGVTMQMHESVFWKDPLSFPPNPSLELYRADIDTTFCLVNRRYGGFPIRVAGDFTCFHLPWHTNFQHQLLEGECEAYLINNRSTNWYKPN